MSDPPPVPPAPRVASWPHWYAPNPYLALLYDALDRHGVEHVPDVPLEVASFAGPGRRADALHLHWLYPLFREGARRGPWPSSRVRRAVERVRRIRDAGATVVLTVHNLEPHGGFRRGERSGYAAIHGLADLRVFHSREARDRAAALYPGAAGDTLVVPHGSYAGAFPAPAPRAETRAREGLAAGACVLLCLGQVRPYKGFDVAAAALSHLPPGPWHLVVAGRPVEGGERSLRRAVAAPERTTLILEEVSPQRVSDLLEAADLVLLPYRAATSSGVLLHGLTAGRGVVVSDLPPFREVLAGEPDVGVFVTPDDPAALAAGIVRCLLTDRPVREAAARRLARSFDWNVAVEPLARWLRARASRPRKRA